MIVNNHCYRQLLRNQLEMFTMTSSSILENECENIMNSVIINP